MTIDHNDELIIDGILAKHTDKIIAAMERTFVKKEDALKTKYLLIGLIVVSSVFSMGLAGIGGGGIVLLLKSLL